MPYTTGNVTTAAPATEFSDQLTAALTAHANWQFVKTVAVTISSVARTVHVWRCLGAANKAGIPFFVYWSVSTDGLRLNFAASEGFNEATNGVIAPCYRNFSGSPGADGTFGNSTTTYPFTDTALWMEEWQLTAGTSGIDFVVSNSFVAGGHRNHAGVFYCGLFERTDPKAAVQPYGVVAASGGSITLINAAASRAVVSGGLSTGNWVNFLPETRMKGYVGKTAVFQDAGGSAVTSSRVILTPNNAFWATGTSSSAYPPMGVFPVEVAITVQEAQSNFPTPGDILLLSGSSAQYVRLASAGQGQANNQCAVLYINIGSTF